MVLILRYVVFVLLYVVQILCSDVLTVLLLFLIIWF